MLFSALCGVEKYSTLTVIGSRSSARLVRAVLDAVDDRIAEAADIQLIGFRLDARLWRRILARFEFVELEACRLGRGWWLKSEAAMRCVHLGLSRCSGVVPRAIRAGQAGWSGLSSISVCEWFNVERFSPMPSIPEFERPPEPSTNEFTRALVGALWSSNLKELCLSRCGSLEWLTELPPASGLEIISLSYCAASEAVFHWVLRHLALRSLSLCWKKGSRFPWAKIRGLRRLRGLDLSDTFLEDSELAEIAQNSKLGSIMVFYTAISAQSWSTLLRWRSLKQVWASTELMNGQMPADLPSETGLDEVVALNAKLEPFEKFLERYPSVKLVQM